MKLLTLTAVVSALCMLHTAHGANYYVGTGMADATGPAADVNMMGYADPSQNSHGIHMRQYARAFVIATDMTGPRVAFVNLDAGWAAGAVKREAVSRLQKEVGDAYTDKNLCVSGTHTHSGIGGYSQYVLFGITSYGFNKQTFNAQVDAIVRSVLMAHHSMKAADIYMNIGELLESNINRSPTSYLRNPQEERAQYNYDVDKNMTVLKFVGEDQKDIGMLCWFAVHGTSMNKTNLKISSDNKGYASQLFEKEFNPGSLPGHGNFVAAFAQSNLGDVSPNTKGPHCLDTGLPCDVEHSTCNGRTELCVAFGPGRDMFESTQIIGTNQYNKALELYKSATIKLSGPVDFRHSFADMTKQRVTLKNGSLVRTCKPAMGYSFAAGTTDGPGSFDFTQGSNSTNPFWNIIVDFIHKPSKELVECQAPKPILLPTGEITVPYMWQPEIVDTQLLRIGQLVIIAVPGEFTTMSGRRLRNLVQETAVKNGLPSDTAVVIAGLANEYSDYITTFEEYQAQRYEAASTAYGPHTLEAYLQLYRNLTLQLAKNLPSPAGPTPPNLISKQISLLPGVVVDEVPIGKKFGEVLRQPESSYRVGAKVMVRFQSANPRNNLRSNDTFLTIEREVPGKSQKTRHRRGLGSWLDEVKDKVKDKVDDLTDHIKDGAGAIKDHVDDLFSPKDNKLPSALSSVEEGWEVVCTDDCWETRFDWIRTSTLLGYSEAKLTWYIPRDAKTGNYRIRHFGTSKSIIGKYTDFVGTTKVFSVTN